jgi:cell shape-determining protein MreC
MLIRISLIIALVAGLATAGINLFQVRAKFETLKADRNNERSLKEQAQTELATTRQQLNQTTAQLKKAEEELTTARRERDGAVATAETQSRRAAQLDEELKKTRATLEDARAELARWNAAGVPVEQVAEVVRLNRRLLEQVDVQKQEIEALIRANARLTNELARVLGGSEYVVRLPAHLRGKVIAYDPKWDFIVVNVGEEQGVLEHGELLISRNGQLVGKAVVRTVEKNRAVANLVPGWKLGEPVEGDEVIPAHPAS